jgi:endo-1,4-beta-xylanase
VTFWGVADDHTWLKRFPIERNDEPLLFDESLGAKPAFWAIVDPQRVDEVSTH